MKKFIFMTTLSLSMTAGTRDIPVDSLHVNPVSNSMLHRLSPSYINEELSKNRTRFIAKELKKNVVWQRRR